MRQALIISAKQFLLVTNDTQGLPKMYQVCVTSYQLCIVSKHNTIHKVYTTKQKNGQCVPLELHHIIYAQDFHSEVSSSLSLQLLPFLSYPVVSHLSYILKT